MASVGAYEAKTHLAALLDRVERGESITITRHGHAVAELVPAGGAPRLTAEEAVDRLLEGRKGRRLGNLSVAELIAEGRR